MALQKAAADKSEAEETFEIVGAFFIAPRRCFRMTRAEISRSAHCEEPVVWKGPWRAVNGEIWTVEACERHKPRQEVSSE
jgi:hypothetical protein